MKKIETEMTVVILAVFLFGALLFSLIYGRHCADDRQFLQDAELSNAVHSALGTLAKGTSDFDEDVSADFCAVLPQDRRNFFFATFSDEGWTIQCSAAGSVLRNGTYQNLSFGKTRSFSGVDYYVVVDSSGREWRLAAVRLSLNNLYLCSAVARSIGEWGNPTDYSRALLIIACFATLFLPLLWPYARKSRNVREVHQDLIRSEHVLQENLAVALRSSEVAFFSINYPEEQLHIFKSGMVAEFLVGISKFPENLAAWRKLVHEDDLPQFDLLSVANVPLQGLVRCEFRMKRSDGVWFWCLVKGKVACNEGLDRPICFDGVIQDVSQRRRYESDRFDLERREEQGRRLESIGALAAGIAHDFNNLLLPILGNAELLATTFEKNCSEHKMLETIKIAVNRASELTEQMLAYSGRYELKLQPVSCKDFYGIVEKNLHTLIPETVHLKTDWNERSEFILADSMLLERVIHGLLNNALEALKREKGHLILQSGVALCDDAQVEQVASIFNAKAGSYFYFEVRDDGKGLTEEQALHAFDPFYTTKYTGRGLGLSAAAGIVRGHGGYITIESDGRSKGATARVYLPLESEEQESKKMNKEIAVSSEGNLILLADDEDMVLDLAAGLLKHLGWQALSFKNGMDALEAFDERGSEIRAAILDMTMVGLSGIDVCNKIHESCPQLPVILSSGYNRDAVMADVKDPSAVTFLAKPYSLSGLKDVLEQCGLSSDT